MQVVEDGGGNDARDVCVRLQDLEDVCRGDSIFVLTPRIIICRSRDESVAEVVRYLVMKVGYSGSQYDH